MDNGAYQKYKQEHPDVYTPLSTYDYIDQFVHKLTNAELVICVVAVALALFVVMIQLVEASVLFVHHRPCELSCNRSPVVAVLVTVTVASTRVAAFARA